jgi:hypothetical protein
MTENYLSIDPIFTKSKSKDEEIGSPLMPRTPCRVLIAGASGSGKSQLTANIIMKGWIPFDKIVLCAKNPDQEVYEELEAHIADVAEENELDPKDLFQIVTDVNDVPKVEDFDKSKKTLLAFDDFITSSKDLPKISDFFVRARHKGVSPFFLTQDFYQVPLIIRRNCNYFFLFGGMSERDLVSLHKDLAQGGLDVKEFKKIYRAATAEKYSFLMIDLVTDKKPLRFRKMFDGLLTI